MAESEVVIKNELEALAYDEMVKLPKFRASLERLLNKKAYMFLFTVHSITKEDLPQFIERATNEGNAVLIQHEHCGYMVVLWKD